jgi:hypothetical protein
MTLDKSDEAGTKDKAKDAAGNIKTGHIKRDTSLHNTLGTSELASGPTKSIDTSGLWYNVEEDCYIDEPALRLGPCEQRDVPFAQAQGQAQILPLLSKPL